jgi:hypothetical protein
MPLHARSRPSGGTSSPESGILQARTADRPSGQHLAAAGRGKPLSDAVRAKMERALGHDFSRVRVHEGAHAESLGAIAYTRGTDLHFAPGRYSPATRSGQELIGHELAHVIQQQAGRVAVPQGKGAPINGDPALEAEAERLGAAAVRTREPAAGPKQEPGLGHHIGSISPRTAPGSGGHDLSPVRIHAIAHPGPSRGAAGLATGAGQPVQRLDWKKWGKRAGLGLLAAGGAVAGGLGAAALGAAVAPVALAATGGALVAGGLGYAAHRAYRHFTRSPAEDRGEPDASESDELVDEHPSEELIEHEPTTPSSSGGVGPSPFATAVPPALPSGLGLSAASSTGSPLAKAYAPPTRRRLPKQTAPKVRPRFDRPSGSLLTPEETRSLTAQAYDQSDKKTHKAHQGAGRRFESDRLRQEKAGRLLIAQAENRKGKEKKKKGRKKKGD